ncbi:tetratricopeptide repeat protein [Tautonia rosea]|uniref:tetratricopeptide repeat protein n=1 Tax=Tautonia rosea TaxID=2728037 RepID=UPI001473A1E4|nr:tetratricopeptide repeat protein [Tautonia rosea]
MRSLTFRLGLAVLCAVILNGCAKKQINSEGKKPDQSDKPPMVASVGSPPTEEECWEYGEGFEDAIFQADGEAISRMIDWQAVVDEATDGVDAPAAVKRDFSQSFVQSSSSGQSGLVSTLIETINQGGRFSPIHVIGGKAQHGVRFRLLTADGGLNYLDFFLARRNDGSIKAVDVFPYSVGESIAQSTRHFYLSAVAESQRNLIDRLTGKEQVLLKHLPTLLQMNENLRTGQFEAVLSAYRNLPESLQRDRLFLVPRYTAAAEIDDEEYAAALADFRKFYPNDPSADLLMIDAHFLQGDFDEALAAINRLDQSIGGDAYLHVLRSNIHLERDDHAAAKSAISQAIDEEPWLIEAYWSLLGLSLSEEDFEETARLLDLIAENFEIEFNDLSEVPEYAGFVASPQYAEWVARQPTSTSIPDEHTGDSNDSTGSNPSDF